MTPERGEPRDATSAPRIPAPALRQIQSLKPRALKFKGQLWRARKNLAQPGALCFDFKRIIWTLSHIFKAQTKNNSL